MELPSALSESLIRRGSIFHSKDYRFRERIGHGKFFVVIGVSQTRVVGFFFINSNINPKEWKNQARFALQYPIKRVDYPFLRYDSFIGCSSLQEWTYADLHESIRRGQTELVGDLLDNHLKDILEQARNSEIFSKEENESYFSE